MNKQILGFCSLALCFLCFVGCNGQPTSPAAAPVRSVISASLPENVSGIANSAAPASTQALVDPSKYESFTGTLEDVAMNQMWVTLDDGQQINFVYSEADLSEFNDSMPGDLITVYYTGTLDDEIHAVKITSANPAL